MPEECDPLPFCCDHIIAQKHKGPTTENDLAWSCYDCNSFKGPNIAGIDPETEQIVPLFNPRSMSWEVHFVWNGQELSGRTAIGRTTIEVLNINDPERVEHRRLLMADGVFL